MWELCNGWHSKNRGLTECIISSCGIAFSDSPPLIDWAQHSPFITRAEAWSRRSAIINSLLSFIQNSRLGQIRMLFLQLYRGQNIHKVSIQLDLGWLAQPNSKGLHDKISMNNCCFEKKNIFIDKVHICVSHEFVDTTSIVQISPDLAVDGACGSITT